MAKTKRKSKSKTTRTASFARAAEGARSSLKRDDVLDAVRELELDLFSREFRTWLATRTDEERMRLISMRSEIASYRSKLETEQLRILAEKLEELTAELKKGFADMQKVIDDTKDFIAALDTLGRVIGLVSRVVTLAV